MARTGIALSSLTLILFNPVLSVLQVHPGLESQVKELYETTPYPDPTVLGTDSYQLCEGEGEMVSKPAIIRGAAGYAWGGVLPWKIRALDAGTGTGADCTMMALELNDLKDSGAIGEFELVCMDLSSASLAHTRKRLAGWGILEDIKSVRVLQGSYTDSKFMAHLGQFDYIHAEGSLQALPDPLEGFRALSARLHTATSVLKVFVYGERPGVAAVQRNFRRLQDARGIETTFERINPSEIQLLRSYIKSLPLSSHLLLSALATGAHNVSQARAIFVDLDDTELADMFLHPIENQFTAKDIRELAHKSGLKLYMWSKNSPLGHYIAFSNISNTCGKTKGHPVDEAGRQCVLDAAVQKMDGDMVDDFIEEHFGAAMHSHSCLLLRTPSEATSVMLKPGVHLAALAPITTGCKFLRMIRQVWNTQPFDAIQPSRAAAHATPSYVDARCDGKSLARLIKIHNKIHWAEDTAHHYPFSQDQGVKEAFFKDLLGLSLSALCIATHADGHTNFDQIQQQLLSTWPDSEPFIDYPSAVRELLAIAQIDYTQHIRGPALHLINTQKGEL
jgi:hypothetical protein